MRVTSLAEGATAVLRVKKWVCEGEHTATFQISSPLLPVNCDENSPIGLDRLDPELHVTTTGHSALDDHLSGEANHAFRIHCLLHFLHLSL